MRAVAFIVASAWRSIGPFAAVKSRHTAAHRERASFERPEGEIHVEAHVTHRFDDDRIGSTRARGRELRGVAPGRRSWLFRGSERGGERAAAMYTLIATAKLNDVDPQARLADVLARIAEPPHTRVQELLPWNWKAAREQALAA